MFSPVNVYRLLNLLSIDVAVGAVICSLFFSEVLAVDFEPFTYLVLALTVWMIYSADHLLDVVSLAEKPSTQRHLFFQKNFNLLRKALVVVGILNVALASFVLHRALFFYGIVLGAFVIVYLLVQRYLTFLKELSGAILYTAGVLIPSISARGLNMEMYHLAMIIHFTIIAWINLLLFSMFDIASDEQDKHKSFTTYFGVKKTRTLVRILFAVCITMDGIQWIAQVSWSSVVLLWMDLVLILIFMNRSYFSENDRYRFWGDAIFFIPVFYLVLR